jgi:hypothetical protein
MSGSINIPVVSKFDPTGIKQAQNALGGFGKSLLSVGALVAGAFAIRGIANFAMESVIAAERAQQFNDILAQVAKTTGVLGSGVDAATDRMIKFADSHELVIGVEAELIKEAQAVLLSFKAVGASADETGGNFDRATKAAFDMAAVLKTDARGSAVQLGKALENPIKGVTALAKAGTTFTDQQRAQIKTLVESNRLLEAQDLILTEVESQYGGAAEAAALGSQKIQLAFGQVQDALGEGLAPAFEKFTNYFINEVVPPLTVFFEDKFPTLLKNLGATFTSLQPAFEEVGDTLRKAFNISEENTLLEGLLINLEKLGQNETFLGFLEEIIEGFAKLLPDLILLVPLMLQLAQQVVPLLLQVLPPLIWFVDKLAGAFGIVNKEIEDAFGNADSFQKQVIGLTDVIVTNIPILGSYNRMWESITRSILDAVKALADYMTRVQGVPSNIRFPVPSTTGARAGGGRVTGGMSYLVGEMGPEIFQPGRGGNIVSNDRIGSGGGTSIVINVTAGMGTNGAQVGEQIVNAIKRYERSSGKVFASA